MGTVRYALACSTVRRTLTVEVDRWDRIRIAESQLGTTYSQLCAAVHAKEVEVEMSMNMRGMMAEDVLHRALQLDEAAERVCVARAAQGTRTAVTPSHGSC